MDDEVRDLLKVVYPAGFVIVAFCVFVGTWIWCIGEYGFLLGVGLGWLPSLIVAVIAGYLWPLIALALAWLAWELHKAGAF